MGLIHGIDVILYEKTQTGTDAFKAPIYSATSVTVENVLVAPDSSEDMNTETALRGDVISFNLAIPKGDSHNWTDSDVEFTLNGETYRGHTVGLPQSGIEDMIPLDWNKKIMVNCNV